MVRNSDALRVFIFDKVAEILQTCVKIGIRAEASVNSDELIFGLIEFFSTGYKFVPGRRGGLNAEVVIITE